MWGRIADLLQRPWHLSDTCSGACIFPAVAVCERERTNAEGCMNVGRGACLEVEVAVCGVYTRWGVRLIALCVPWCDRLPLHPSRASQDVMLLQESAGAWLALALVTALTLSPGMAVPYQDCTGAECPPLENCIEEALEPGACCATCVQQGCACEGYQYYDCVVHGGFADGRVPAGQSYFVDFGSTECSCPPGGGKITCQFMLCPELPPNCIEAVEVADSCPQCGQVGCVHIGRKYAAGHTVHLSPCRACHCPDAGGELICYQLPGCQGNFSDAEEGDSERQYEDPYSYDQEVAEAETTVATVNEIQAGAEGPPAALGGGNLPPSSFRATPRPAALPRPTAAAALGPPAPMQAKARRVTLDMDEEEEEQVEEMVATEPPAAGGPGRLNSLPATPPVIPDLPGREKEAEAKAGLEENFIPDVQATPSSAGPEGAAPLPRLGPAGLIPSLTTDSSPGDPVKSSSHPILSTRPPDRAQVTPSPEVPEELPLHPRSRPPSQAEEDTDPNSVHSVPRGGPDGKALSCVPAGPLSLEGTVAPYGFLTGLRQSGVGWWRFPWCFLAGLRQNGIG